MQTELENLTQDPTVTSPSDKKRKREQQEQQTDQHQTSDDSTSSDESERQETNQKAAKAPRSEYSKSTYQYEEQLDQHFKEFSDREKHRPIVLVTGNEDGLLSAFLKPCICKLTETERFLLPKIEKSEDPNSTHRRSFLDAVEVISIFQQRGSDKYPLLDDNIEDVNNANGVIEAISQQPGKYRVQDIIEWREIFVSQITKLTNKYFVIVYCHENWA